MMELFPWVENAIPIQVWGSEAGVTDPFVQERLAPRRSHKIIVTSKVS